MGTETTDIKHTLSRSVGQWRPVGRIQPGWWIHLEPITDAPEGTVGSWEQVITTMDWSGGSRTLVLDCDSDNDGNAIRAPKAQQAVTLTEREARKHGLGAED